MRYRSLFYPLFFISLSLVSCEFKCEMGGTASNEEQEKKYKPVEQDGALLYNGIELTTHDVRVKKAYLVNRDNAGEMIDKGNFVDMKKGVKLILLIDTGWKETENGIRLGASMNAVTDKGEKLLNNADLFEGVESISAADSKILALSLYFDEWTARKPVTINTSFKVWDKNSDSFIEGTYTIHTK